MTEVVNNEENVLDIEMNDVVSSGEGSMGLADFLSVDVSQVEASEGFEVLPAGIYRLTNTAIKINSATRKDKATGEEYKVPNVALQFEVDEVVSVQKYDGDLSSLVGRKHSEFISLPTFDSERFIKAVGRLKAIVYGITGLTREDDPLSSIPEALKKIAKKSFTAKIKNGKYTNSNGEEVVTADIDTKSIKPVE